MQIVKERAEGAATTLNGKLTLDLAFYELGNIVWKKQRMQRSIKPEEAARMASHFAELLGLMKIERTPFEEMGEIVELGATAGLSFYDASYLHGAMGKGLTLVTEDRQLIHAAERLSVKAIKAEELTSI